MESRQKLKERDYKPNSKQSCLSFHLSSQFYHLHGFLKTEHVCNSSVFMSQIDLLISPDFKYKSVSFTLDKKPKNTEQ